MEVSLWPLGLPYWLLHEYAIMFVLTQYGLAWWYASFVMFITTMIAVKHAM